MLNGGVEYVDQYKYIQTMLSILRDWSTGASDLLQPGCGVEYFQNFLHNILKQQPFLILQIHVLT